jgi:hypothetical protein
MFKLTTKVVQVEIDLFAAVIFATWLIDRFFS